MLENTAIICNTYLDAINKVIKRPMVAIGGSYNINEFKKETAPLFKQQYLNLLIFDASVIKDDVLEALCYLKANLDSNVRIIVLYPNLDDEKIYRQILAYGIYDVIDTKIDKDTMSDEDINKLIISELSWLINEPVRFNKVKDKLKLDAPVVNEIKVEETPKALKETNKKRLVGFFEDDDVSAVLADILKRMSLCKAFKVIADFFRVARTVGNFANLFEIINICFHSYSSLLLCASSSNSSLNQTFLISNSFLSRYESEPASVEKSKISLYEQRHCFLSPLFLLRAFEPYFPSPSSGCPMEAKCALIWCVLPVRSSTSVSERPFLLLSTRYFVLISFEASFWFFETKTLFLLSFFSR